MLIIGDIHGSYKTLLALIEKLPKGEEICFAGDLIDRGPQSRNVIQYAIDNNIKCVRGNHEQMMIDELKFSSNSIYVQEHMQWMNNGGVNTILSYNKDFETLKKHYIWMSELPLYLEFPELKNDQGQHLLVSHSTAAAVWDKFSHDDPSFRTGIMWDRKSIPAKIEGIYNIFGHTPMKKPLVREHFANIDTGACFKRGDYGKLTAIQWPSLTIYQQKNIE